MPKVPFYYGWVILPALSVTEMLALGTTAYAAGLFVLPLQNEFSLSRTGANWAFSILLAGATVFAPIMGKYLDRYSVRWVLSLGALALGLAFAVIALSHSLWLMGLMLLVPAAMGFVAIGTLTTGTLLSRWFYKRRGLALGIGAVATSGGGFFTAQVLSPLIQSHGWRATLLIEAAFIVAVSIFLAVFVVRDRPSDMGLENHSENENRPRNDAHLPDGPARWRWNTILRDPTFWGAAMVLAMVSGISQALVTTLPPYAIQLGFGVPAAARLILLFAIAAGGTKILGGLLTDYTDKRLLMFSSGLVMMAAASALLFSSSYAALAAATILAGVALGCALPASSATIALVFGAPSFGRVMGWAYVLVQVSAIILPLLAGTIYDKTHNYNAAFAFFAVLSFIGALFTMLIPRPLR